MKKLLLVTLVMVCTPAFAVKKTVEKESDSDFIAETRRRIEKRSAELKQLLAKDRQDRENREFTETCRRFKARVAQLRQDQNMSALYYLVLACERDRASNEVATINDLLGGQSTPRAASTPCISPSGSPIAAARSYPANCSLSLVKVMQDVSDGDITTGKVKMVLALVGNQFVVTTKPNNN
jgi:hypothetical protein